MIAITEQKYRDWQNKLAAGKMFRFFWTGAGIYSVLGFIAVGIYLLFFSSASARQAAIFAAMAGLFTRYAVCEIIHLFYKKAHPYQCWDFNQPRSWLFSLAD